MKTIADLVILNGSVWTGNPSLPHAEAVAVLDEHILFVGSNEEISGLVGPGTSIVNLAGESVLPGFIDSHTHFLDGGFALTGIPLRSAAGRSEFVGMIESAAKNTRPGEWIRFGDWDHNRLNPPEIPEKSWIDPVTPLHPVCLDRMDKHCVLVNSLALKIAGISGDTLNPPGGEIERDPVSGAPTGILKEEAISLVTRFIPRPGREEMEAAAASACVHANRMGITSIHEMAYRPHFETYQELLRRDRLTVRICEYIPLSWIEKLADLNIQTPFGGDFLKIGGVKGFVDGSLGSHTALFFEPYLDRPEKSGILISDMFPEGIMPERLRKAESAGFQAAVHAIGDKANHDLLDIMEAIMTQFPRRNRRWRIEHAQHLIFADISRFGRLGILVSVQPHHLLDDGCWAEAKIGKKRAETTYAFRSLLDSGARLIFGSDWTVAPLNPLLGIYAAVTRRTSDGAHPGGWIPGQKITLEEALAASTINGAYAEFAEDRKGTLEKGKLADIVILDGDIFAGPSVNIKDTQVRMTIMNGRIVYDALKES